MPAKLQEESILVRVIVEVRNNFLYRISSIADYNNFSSFEIISIFLLFVSQVLSHTQVLERHIWSVLFLGAKDVLDQINQGFTLESPPHLVGSLGSCLRLVDA